MVVGEIAESVDLVVIGGGPGGYVAALRAAQRGREVVLVERNGGADGVGGTCLHVGCIPSKALIELADARGSLDRLGARGLGGTLAVDLSAFQVGRREMVGRLRDGVAALLARRRVRVIDGTARLTAPGRAAVERPDGPPLFLEFRDAILATGSRPVQLPALPLDDRRIVDSTGALAIDAVPASVVVVGGGVIGLELACALHELGAAVTIVELADQLLPGVDPAISSVVRVAIAKRGIDVRCGERVVGDDGEAVLVANGDGERRLPAELVVVAAGRRPNSDDLGLQAAGIDVAADGTVPVGADLRTAAGVAAIGDLTAGPALAHKAMAQGVVAADALCGLPAAFDARAIPAVVYSQPEVALAGISEREAAAQGIDVRVVTVPMAAVPRAATMAASEGLARLLADPETGAVLGVQLVGRHVSELIAAAALAIEMGATVEDVAATIHPHPSMSEVLAEAAHLADGLPLHVPG